MSFKIMKAVGAVADSVTLIAQKGAPKVAESVVVGFDALNRGLVRLDAEVAYSNHKRLSKLLRSSNRSKRAAAVYAAREVKDLLDSLK